ncbi:MAG: rRNA pseudouridine synthase [Chloroflexota bacterium]|nr:rRNA pseudouridine synthase [Chloroflexota bacterium]
MTNPVRLHKLIARAGVASLRASERLIEQGRVQVNGQIVTTPGAVALPDDEIVVDGRRIESTTAFRYVVLNKPPLILSTAHDEMGRITVVDLLRAPERLYPVGRLDRESEGLLLLTNDGRLAERMMHPRFGMHKSYEVEVEGLFAPSHLASLRAGVSLEDGPSIPISARVLNSSLERSTVILTLGEGRNRQVRRTLEALGFTIVRLVRIGLGPLQLSELRPGQYRDLTLHELRSLRRAAGLPEAARP